MTTTTGINNLNFIGRYKCIFCGKDIGIFSIFDEHNSTRTTNINCHCCEQSNCNTTEKYVNKENIKKENKLKKPQKWKNKFNKKVPKWQKIKF